MITFRGKFLAIGFLTALIFSGNSYLAEAENQLFELNLPSAAVAVSPDKITREKIKWPELNLREFSESIRPSDLSIGRKIFWGIKTAFNHIDVAKIVPVSVYSLNDICHARIDPRILELGAMNVHIENADSKTAAWIDWRDSAAEFCSLENGFYQNHENTIWENVRQNADAGEWVAVTENIAKDLIRESMNSIATETEQFSDDYILMFGDLGRFDIEPRGKYWLFCNDKQPPVPNSICFETFSVSPYSQHRKLTAAFDAE